MENKVEKFEHDITDLFNTYTFAFYPQESSCHSFGEEPPKSWEDVYKVYFQYEITRDALNIDEPGIVFRSYHDENSVMKTVAKALKAISNHEKDYSKYIGKDYFAFGGVSWRIDEVPIKKYNHYRTTKVHRYRITMTNDANEKFEFVNDILELGRFADFLDKCCEYMLAHGEPMQED